MSPSFDSAPMQPGDFRPDVPAPKASASLELPAGTQQRLQKRRPDGLQDLASADLAQELLHRIRNGEFTSQDLLIRYGNEIQLELDRHLDVIRNRFGITRLRYLFANFHLDIPHVHPPIAGATYAEFGAGSQNPFGLLFLFLALGASRGIVVDLDEMQDGSLATKALAASASLLLLAPSCLVGSHPITAARILENLSSFDLRKLHEGDAMGIDTGRLCYLRESVFRTSLRDGEVDVLLSNAFLEHLPRMDEAVAEMARITKKGGLGLHNLDALDHRSYESRGVQPLAFLEIDSDEEIVHLCNRLRPLQFVEIFERHGFDVLQVHAYDRVPVDPSQRRRFVEPFRSMRIEDLEVTQARFCVRRR